MVAPTSHRHWLEITGLLESRVLQGVWSGRVTRRLICQPLVIDRGLLDLASQRDQIVMAHVIVGPGQVAQGGYHLVALRLVQGCDGSGHAAFLIFWRHGLLAAAIAAIGGGLTELPHMCTCSDLVNRRPSWPRSMM